jgi:hypothetical protein
MAKFLEKPKTFLSIRFATCVRENDYQLDISLKEDRETYKRIIDRASEMGLTRLLFAPRNSDVSSRQNNTDPWGWEQLLWFGYGQKVSRIGNLASGRGGPCYCGGQPSGLKNGLSSPRPRRLKSGVSSPRLPGDSSPSRAARRSSGAHHGIPAESATRAEIRAETEQRLCKICWF